MEDCSEISCYADICQGPAERQFAGLDGMKQENLREILLALEQELLTPQVRSSDVRLGEILAEGFVEFGSSGRIYDKHSIIRSLTQAKASEYFQINNFRLVTSSENMALVTYMCEASTDTGDVIRSSNRSSFWILRERCWQMIFHQGTRAE